MYQYNTISVYVNANKKYIYCCPTCCEVFPFEDISDDELIFENSPIEQDYQINKLVDICSQFEFSSSNYSDYNSFDFENDIDPANNFYNNSTSKCDYYTDSEFNDKMCKLNGLSFIQFNARSLKANLQKINDYLQ